MGVIKCSKCGKLYDYEKYSGICPKCARYNKETSAAEDHQEYHNKYDGGYSHNEQDDHYSYHQRYDDNKNPHRGQLDGVQVTLREVMGAEHKVNLEAEPSKKKKMDKKTKIILGAIFGVFFINLIIPFFGPFLIFFVILGAIIYSKRKK